MPYTTSTRDNYQRSLACKDVHQFLLAAGVDGKQLWRIFHRCQ